MAQLEEFIQEKYIEHFEEFSENSKIFEMLSIPDIRKYFYQPPVGVESYVVDKDGFALYLINKKNLPKEIKDALVGGDAGDGEFSNYQSLKDVYGVTEDLKVYYCSDGKGSIYGVTVDKLDKEDKLRNVIDEKSSLGSYLLGKNYDNFPSPDGKLNAEELRSIWKLEIDETAGLTNLNELYNLTNLQELKLTNLSLENLDGIEYVAQLEKIEFNNCKIKDYSKLCYAQKIVYLYFNNTIDEEVNKFVKATKETDFPELKYFGIKNCGDELTSIESLSKLKEITDTVNYLDFYNNKNILRYDGLSIFENVTDVNTYGSSKLESLSFIKNMKKIKNIYSYDTNLSDNEEEKAIDSLSGKKEMSKLDLRNNKNLQYLRGITLSGVYKFSLLYLSGCPNFLIDQVTGIANIYNRIWSANKSIDSIFLGYLLNSSTSIDYSNKNLTDDSEQIVLIDNMDEASCLNVEVIRLNGNSELSNEKLNEILPKFENCISICLNGCHKLKSIEFVKRLKNLEEILLYDTGVKTGEKGDNGDIIGLELLNDCKNLMSIELNNSEYNENGIVLKNIINVINGCRRDEGVHNLYYYNVGVCRISNLVDQLPNCKEFNYFELSKFDGVDVIDLSEAVSKISFGYSKDMPNEIKVILPKKVGKFRLSSYERFDFSYCESIDELLLEETNALREYNAAKKISESHCKVFKYSNFYYNINEPVELQLNENSDFKTKITYADEINLLAKNDLHEIYINEPTDYRKNNSRRTYLSMLDVSLLDFSNGFENLEVFSSNDCNINNLNFLKHCSKLRKIECVNGNCENVEELSILTNVEEMIMSNNKIRSLRFLKNYNKLALLNVSGNLINDEYIFNVNSNSEGDLTDIETGNNIDILVNLHNNYSLKSLNIKNNLGITESYKLSACSGWTEKLGF